ncbi:MAG TPA: Uma2 family endonuclease [Pirellulaceae bacterium]|nr:Uma2 family endonuclease [Pirellulaceae bacterium]
MIRKLATIDDLYAVDGKAERVHGEIVLMPPTGDFPGTAGDAILSSLWSRMKSVGGGRAVGDCKAFLADLPHRKSFCPNAAWYTGPLAGMKFYPVPPAFAVEVRSENDYGAKAEADMAAKRADYFAAGTLVVWDVDLLSYDVVRVYRATSPDEPTIYRRGQIAEAEPAVPNWRMPVDELFA